ncbi:spore coat protein [Pseudalkalibacillus sp. JSM 102089]|uniref:spore coat protein n=1 Tax=Pseudalkalibacillus sp. JSM 102089 TaxID=3229856 RepID=UPI003525FB2D
MAYLNSDTIAPLLGKQVKVNLKGPEAKVGILFHIATDHFMLQTEKEMIYYNLDHVKSVSVDTTTNPESIVNTFLDPIRGSSITEVLGALHYKWVKINRGGPEHVEGILINVASDHILLLVKTELVRITLFHIKSFSTIETMIKEVPEKIVEA